MQTPKHRRPWRLKQTADSTSGRALKCASDAHYPPLSSISLFPLHFSFVNYPTPRQMYRHHKTNYPPAWR